MRRAAPLLALAAVATAGLVGCGAGSPTYASCVDDLDCAEPDRCTRLLLTRSDGTEAAGNLCTPACESDADCPDGGACVRLEADPTETFFCAARCEASGDCFAGFACTEVDDGTGAPASLCLP